MGEEKTGSGLPAFLKLGGKHKGVIFALILGLVLLLIGSLPFGKLREKRTAGDADTLSDGDLALENYRKTLEEEIRALCLCMDGVRDATVAVGLGDGFSYVYAVNTETRTTGDTRTYQETYVTVGSGSTAEALRLSCCPPTVAGIGVVCRGGSASTYSELTVLLAAAYGLPLHKIYVTSADPGA